MARMVAGEVTGSGETWITKLSDKQLLDLLALDREPEEGGR